MRKLDSTGDLYEQLSGASSRHRLSSEGCVQLTAVDKFHAEVAGALALADFVNRNNPWMLQTRRRFCLATKTIQVRCARPLTETDYF